MEAITTHQPRQEGPELAAIIVMLDTYNALRRTVSHLKAQTAAPRMELVIVASSPDRCDFEEHDLSGFHSWQVVAGGEIKSIAYGFAAGIRSARAPIVAFNEDHSFPEPEWAETLINAHKKEWIAVGPGVINGNPESLVSWGDFYASYSEWAPPVASGTVRHLPGHNSSYKREALLAFGDRLDSLLQAESVLHRYFRAEGHELWLESSTHTSHCNFTAWGPWLKAQYYTGRQFAATWAQPWSWGRRLIFTVGSPGIPWLRFWRIQKYVRRAHSAGFLLRLAPLLLAGLLVNGLGQMMGYAAGASDSIEKVTEHERHRFKGS